jgi:two-component system, OmpR family, sensor kinase
VKLPTSLDVNRLLPTRVPFRLRVFFRGTFLLLALATIALALAVLQDEKERSYRNYQDGFKKNQAQIAAKLRHPTGQLVLLNPKAYTGAVTPLRPVVLPFSALDFDDRNKAQQAVEMAGCLVQYPDAASMCVAIGNNPFAGGYIYAVGSFNSGALVPHISGELDLALSHRARITVDMRGEQFRWIAPFELTPDSPNAANLGNVRGRLVGFVDNGPITPATRPLRDFRGWLWQDGRCVEANAIAPASAPATGAASQAQAQDAATCTKRAFVSVRLPIELFREAIYQKAPNAIVWPPADLDQIKVRIEMLAPSKSVVTSATANTPSTAISTATLAATDASSDTATVAITDAATTVTGDITTDTASITMSAASTINTSTIYTATISTTTRATITNTVNLAVAPIAPVFDSNTNGATAPFSWAELTPLLLPGEKLRVRKLSAASPNATNTSADIVNLAGAESTEQLSPLIGQLIRRLEVDGFDAPITSQDIVSTPLGRYELTLTGDIRTVNKTLTAVATRVSWFVGAMLLAIFLTWLAIELIIIRRITELTRRAATVSKGVKSTVASDNLSAVDLSDLRGGDELGVLAGGLQDLLQRVNEDVRREHIRVAQEKDTWHAVGHEIMSPLQSLMVLHGSVDDPAHRYISRMQQAVRVLYGSASPSEAFESTALNVQTLDVNEFLSHIASNSAAAGIQGVTFTPATQAVTVRADEYSLEDAVSHILRNAQRYRLPNTPIAITLTVNTSEGKAPEAVVTIHNQGPHIAADMLGKIFEYGVSDQQDAGALGNRGQGLFVAKTYMAKMGGTITARNVDDGVCFELSLQYAGGRV